MTVLQVAQKASLALGLEVPTTLFTNTSRTALEMQVMINDCVAQILEEYDWQALKKVAAITGDDVEEDFPMPDDFDRMVRDADMWTNFMPFWNGQQVQDVNSWLAMEESGFFAAAVPLWIIYDNLFHVRPVLGTGSTLKYFYVSNYLVKAQGDTLGTLSQFNDDTQSFVLDELLLRYCLVYNWKQQKGLDYAADLQNYSDRFSYNVGKDKGPRRIIEGRGSRLGGWPSGWPFSGTW